MQDTSLLRTRILAVREDARNGALNMPGLLAMLDAFGDHLDQYNEHLKAEAEAEALRPAQTLKAVLSRFSYSEELALTAVMRALPSPQGGLIVSAKIADDAGLSRSIIVNVLRKLEGAGIVKAQSLGMRGTHVKILFPGLREHLLSVA